MYKKSLKILQIFSSHKCLCKRCLSLINAYVRDIYHLLILSRQNDSLTHSLHKRTRFMNYKYPINFSISKFTIFILYFTYIFRASLSKISFLSFSLQRYLLKYPRVPRFIKKDHIQVSATSDLGLSCIRY